MPFNSPLALMRTHQPLREHLQAALGGSVDLLTSPNFLRYLDDVGAGRFDVIILAPHFAVLAAQDYGFRPIFHYKGMLEPLLVVRQESSLSRPGQVQGRTIGVASKLALVSIVGIQRFRLDGVAFPGGFRLVERGSHATAIAAVAIGELDGAITTENSLRQAPDDLRARLRSIPLGVALPHLVTMANPRLGGKRIAELRAALSSFAESAAGKRFFAETGYGGYDSFDADDLQQLQPYAEIARRLLAEEARQ